MQTLSTVIDSIGSFIWGWPMIILLLGTHIFLTVRLRFPQRYVGKAIRLSVTPDKNASGDVSQFAALATALAATIGTGNIIGVATAVKLGGPGAVLWCWLTGVFGMATKYSEGLLAVEYRQKGPDGEMTGGPMYALEKGLNAKWLGVLFCIFTVLASFGIGSTVQSNAISTTMADSFGIPVWASGLIVTILAALVIVFGVKGISRVCSLLVPFMAVLYLVGCIWILCVNHSVLGESVLLIFRSAFTGKAAGGGFAGAAVMMACRYGIARSLFSNESGMGSAPIVAAAARTTNPVRQALVSSTGTFWDTVVICAMTGLVLVSSMIMHPEMASADSGVLTSKAFESIPYIGKPLLAVGVLTFAFSTIIGWAYYSRKAFEYLTRRSWLVRLFQIIWICSIFVGAIANLTLVWSLADIMNAFMAVPNIISLLLLSGVCVALTRKYLWEGNLEQE